MWESVVPHINKAQKNYLCHWCPTVVSGSRRRLLPSRCPGFLLLLFGNSPATRAIIGVKFGQSSSFLLLLPEPSSSGRERTNCWVGKQKHHHLVRWISFYVMEIGLDARRFRLKLWRGEVVTIRKRRAGWRGGEDAEGGGGRPSWLAEHRKSPKNHSPTLKSSEEWHIGWWLGRRGRSQLRRVTDSRAEEEGAAPPGKEDHPASDTSPASH